MKILGLLEVTLNGKVTVMPTFGLLLVECESLRYVVIQDEAVGHRCLTSLEVTV